MKGLNHYINYPNRFTKKVIGFLIGIFAVHTMCTAQDDVVAWNYSAKKISDKEYELHLKATIRNGWHIYSQKQPENFIGKPTTIKFNKHALFIFSGTTEEVGKLQKSKEPVLETEAWQYANEVEFVQKVTLKKNAKTNISGIIDFQACTSEKCLPSSTALFNITIE